MSRRSHLYELTRQLRRYLTWQQAQGVDAFVPADEVTRKLFEERQKAHRDRQIADLKSQITDDPPSNEKHRSAPKQRARPKAPQSQDRPATNPPTSFPASPAQKRSSKAEEKSGPSKSESGSSREVTASTPLWKKHDPIHEITEKKRQQNQAARSSAEASPHRENTQTPTTDVGNRAPNTPAEKMAFLRDYLGDCQRCPLCEKRRNIVFGDGAVEARLMFIGEGPGQNEDKQGLPFVGKSGQLLTKMIEAMGLDRSEVYITNVVKCRPPGNRNPAPLEIKECAPFLKKQIQVIEPEAIVTLGRFASNTLLESDDALGRMRGRWHEHLGVAVMPTYHPAYLLRNEGDRGLKKKVWSDLQMVMDRLGLEGK